jgi:hypothetical protein
VKLTRFDLAFTIGDIIGLSEKRRLGGVFR